MEEMEARTLASARATIEEGFLGRLGMTEMSGFSLSLERQNRSKNGNANLRFNWTWHYDLFHLTKQGLSEYKKR